VLTALVAEGYDRDFRALAEASDDGPIAAAPLQGPTPGCAGIEIDPIVGSVSLPVGTTIDLGGIGKGLAADLVVGELCDAGALGAIVNIGGDLCAFGEPPTAAGWIVDVEHLEATQVGIAAGGIATSSTYKRHWVRDGIERHHLLDPFLGRSTASGLAAVTVIAGTAASAEVLTKAAFVGGLHDAPKIIRDAGATGILVGTTGRIVALDGIEQYLR
jgi:thiamine biosynthesis lipoprotein